MVKKQAVKVHKSHMNKTRVLFKLFSNTEHLNYFKLHAKNKKQQQNLPKKKTSALTTTTDTDNCKVGYMMLHSV